jgi:plasmid stability protein
MKTTLDLPDDLMRAVKIRAAEHNLKLKDIVADALRVALNAPVAGRLTQAGSPSAPDPAASITLNLPPAEAAAAQRRQRFAALLAQLDQVPDLPQPMEPLAWDDLGLPL